MKPQIHIGTEISAIECDLNIKTELRTVPINTKCYEIVLYGFGLCIIRSMTIKLDKTVLETIVQVKDSGKFILLTSSQCQELTKIITDHEQGTIYISPFTVCWGSLISEIMCSISPVEQEQDKVNTGSSSKPVVSNPDEHLTRFDLVLEPAAMYPRVNGHWCRYSEVWWVLQKLHSRIEELERQLDDRDSITGEKSRCQ